MKKSKHNKNVASYFERSWKLSEKWCYAGETLCIHYAYYDKNTKNFKDAVYKMNDLIGELLKLEENKSEKILDAGCGVGGTSIYLGEKYPNVQFTGITISQGQVEMGKEFIKDRNITNVKIMKEDYNKTKFPSNYFNSVFAIESTGYSENIEDFINEMQRVLKPGGKLVVLDGFRTEVQMNPFLQKIYEKFLFGRGYQKLDLPRLKTYLTLLEKKGFKEIYHKDISKNVARSQIRGIIIAIPFFLSYLIKRTLTFGKYNSKKNYFDFSMGAAVLTPIIALKQVSRYYITTANKKRDDQS